MQRALIVALAVVLQGCPDKVGSPGPQGEQGPQGLAGPQGPQGVQGERGPAGDVLIVDGGAIIGPPGARGSSVVVTPIAAGAVCGAGGVRISYEDGGVAAVICNGTPGAQGIQGAQGQPGTAGQNGAPGASVQIAQVDAGVGCANGGVRLWVDGGQSAYVCNGAPGLQGQQGIQGVQGTPGQSVAATVLPYGDANCPNGGTRFVVGSTITYACNGAAGGVGPPGAPGGGGDGGSGSNPIDRFAYSFAGFTSATFPGNMGGIVGVNAKCNAEFPGAHLCTYREYMWSGVPTGVPTGGAWVDNYSSTSNYNNFPRDRSGNDTCTSWTSSTAYASIIETTGLYTYVGLQCGTARPLACCRSNVAVFRGFTTATTTGNMGGLVGANARCHAQFAGSHLCTYREYQWAGSATGVPAGGAWVDNYSSTSSYNNFPRDRSGNDTCTSWTSDTAYASIIETTGIYTYVGLQCGTARPLACCGP